MLNKKLIYTFLFVLGFTAANAQYQKGQWGFGGEFSFVNSRNTLSRSTTDFSETYRNGFNLKLVAGKFSSPKTFIYGVVDAGYNNSTANVVYDNVTNSVEQEAYTSVFTLQAGIGLRRYFVVNEKNIVGFYLQGQLQAGNSWTSTRSYNALNDSVYQDASQKYPTRIISAQINPGVYVNVTEKWQLTFNVGNLYFSQTFIPEWVEYGGSRRNSSFGLDVNLFDFRLGVLYTPFKD